MKIYNQNRNYFLAHSINNYIGAKCALNFLDDFFKESIIAFKKFYDSLPVDEQYHGFQYREQQAKTYLTIGLGKTTNGSLMQECPIDRKDLSDKNESYQGRLDYWANFQNSSFLIEVKHKWVRYYPNSKSFHFYYDIKESLNSAMSQVNRMENKTWFVNHRNLFTFALVVAPVFSRVPKDNMPFINMSEQTIQSLIKNAEKIDSNIFGFWRLEKNLIHPNTWLKNGKEITSFLPGLCFIGKLNKITKR